KDTVGVIPDFGDVTAEFSEDDGIAPGRNAKEVLEDFTADTEVVGNGLSGLARQRGQFTLEDELGVAALLRTLKKGEVALQKGLDAVAGILDLFDREHCVVEEGLGFGGFQDAHRFPLFLSVSSFILSCLPCLENPYRLQ